MTARTAPPSRSGARRSSSRAGRRSSSTSGSPRCGTRSRGGRSARCRCEEIRAFTTDFDAYFRACARDLAEQGAGLARAGGLEAEAVEQESKGAAWRGLLAAARAAGAAVVVVGSRGHGAIASTVLGSVSSGLAHNAETPVLVIPALSTSDPKEQS